ncbi:hypothetical protein C0033_08925 [Clostridium sp. chh4-2]|uniref:hypothetical protein n=1 Tax=Clostridium sp. chh4-2 TaxID=2067550 RepID=UPI000CCF2AB0|nr:hypothetical protein [Clostridium sp. chh4-2]PNV62226.1 hypothetical protein C0033_08925 [Clostridium sp. chh4-2]
MTVRKGWNAHGDIGMVLENIARNILNPGVPYGADYTIYDASAIESGTFAEVMICLLRHEKGYEDIEEIEDFSKSLADIWGKSLHDIEPEKAQKLLDKFVILIK